MPSMKGYGRGPASSRKFQKGTLEYIAAEEALRKEMEEEEKKRKQKKAYSKSQGIVNRIAGNSPVKRVFDVE